jgi:hypothetical protein
VSLNAVTRLEKAKVDSRVSTFAAIEKALTKAGIYFLAAGERGEGVRLRSPKDSTARRLLSQAFPMMRRARCGAVALGVLYAIG